MSKFHKGKFTPKNPDKYRGNPTEICYRSSWELRAFRWLDDHPNIDWWQSEEVFIWYKSPVDGKAHRYFPDLIFSMTDKDGKKSTKMIEIKPLAQTKPPKVQTKRTKRYINEVFEFGKNQAKWKAAEAYCADRGMTFHIVTEKELYG